MKKDTICPVTNKPYYTKIDNAKLKAVKYLLKAEKFWNNGDCIKADFKRANEMLNLSYEELADGLRQELLQARMEDRESRKWNELYWKAPSCVYHWTKECTKLYTDAGYGRYVEEILILKDRKANWKSIVFFQHTAIECERLLRITNNKNLK